MFLLPVLRNLARSTQHRSQSIFDRAAWPISPTRPTASNLENHIIFSNTDAFLDKAQSLLTSCR
jgi:hypothetical protein